MKKKVLSLVLLVALMATGCVSNKQVVTPEYDWMENGASVSTQQSSVAEGESAETPSVEESSETPSKEESSVEASVEESEDKAPSVSMPDALSDNIYDFQIEINGEVLQFPMWYSDFAELGWTYGGDPADLLDAMSYYSFAEFTKDGLTFDFVVYNYGINAIPVSECLICGVSMDEWSMKETNATVKLPGEITYGVSTLADLEAAHGAPTDSYEGTYYTEYTYQGNSYYNSIRLEVSTETNVLSAIDMMTLVDLEGIAPEANIFYDETPAMVTNYVAPTEMSGNLKDYTVQVGDVLLALPAPLSVLLNDGWVIDDSDAEIIAGRWTQYMYLKKGEQRLSVSVINTHDNAVAIANTMIYDLEVSKYYQPENVSYAGGLTLGITETELLAIIDGYTYESSDYDDSRVYNIELEDDYNTSYSIWIREGVVDQMSVSYKPDSLYE